MGSAREVWEGFVVLEGIDGAGTTTLSRLLGEALDASGRRHARSCEPTDGPIGKTIREGLSGRLPLASRTMALLFAADRQEHLYGAGGIRQTLDRGLLALSDRYLFSSLAYQTLEQPYGWVDGLNAPYPLPGHLIFLGLPVALAQDRLSGRSQRDIFDESSVQDRVAANYRRILDSFRGHGMAILELDASQPPERLRDDSLAFLGVSTTGR